jgi:hypothetical protein
MFDDFGGIVMIVMIAFFQVIVLDVAEAFGIVMLAMLAANLYVAWEETSLKRRWEYKTSTRRFASSIPILSR